MTSNLGSDILLDKVKDTGVVDEETRRQVLDLAKMHFKPEFLNRIDDIIMFTPLNQAAIQKIVEKFIKLLSNRLENQEITLKITPQAESWLAEEGYNPAFGARPLQRFITNKVETPLSKEIIAGHILPHSEVTIELENDKLVFHARQLIEA